MPIETYYVKALTKKSINESIAAGDTVLATNYKMGQETTKDIRKLNDGDVIKVYKKELGGSPYAHAYGNWSVKKQKVT